MSGIKFGQDVDFEDDVVLDLGTDDQIEVVEKTNEQPKVADEDEKQKLNRNQRLKIQRDKERAARQELEQQLAELKEQINAAKRREEEAKKLGTEHVLRTAEARREQIKKEISLASDNGDSARLAELLIEASKLATDEGLARLQMPRNTAPVQQPQSQYAPPPQRQENVNPKLQRWLSQNPWFQVDRERTNAAFAIHTKLVNEEFIEEGTDEYFEELDKALGKMNRTSSTRAPTTQGERSSSQPRKINVQLSPEEMATAKRMNVSYEAYARQKLLMEQNTDARGYVLVDTGKGSK